MEREWIDAAAGLPKTVQRFEVGQPIFREGDLPRGVYIVEDGTVEVIISARPGTMETTRVAERGETLGLSAVAMQHPHECSATARSRCDIGFIDRHDFLRASEKTPATWFAVLHFLSRELHTAYEEIRSLAHR